MDTKLLAKSKRAHSLHHKKHNPNQKAKGVANATVTDKSPVKAVKEKPRIPQGPAVLPSNWDRYEDEDESQTESQTSQPSEFVVPKSKGADYGYLISEAKSRNSTKISSEIFPSFDEFVSDFGNGKDSYFAVRGESLLSSVTNDSFFVEDKTPASYEAASFLSLNLQALSEQLSKIDLPKRLFMEADLFPPELLYSEKGQKLQNASNDHHELTPSTTSHHYQTVEDQTTNTGSNPMVQPKPQTTQTELDTLLDSFTDSNLKEKASTSTSKGKTVVFDIDGTLDDLLNETSMTSRLDENSASSSHEVVNSFPLDDFDSWLDTI